MMVYLDQTTVNFCKQTKASLHLLNAKEFLGPFHGTKIVCIIQHLLLTSSNHLLHVFALLCFNGTENLHGHTYSLQQTKLNDGVFCS